MSQRLSGYRRQPDEAYETPAWVVAALLAQLRAPIRRAWDPCDRASGRLVTTLRTQGVDAVGTAEDFLTVTIPPAGAHVIVTNPPYGGNRRGELAVRFIEHALELPITCIAMLLRVDFDSALTRQHIFGRCPDFAGKIILLNRIKWFAGPRSPSDNHAWFIWKRSHVGPPVIRYTARVDFAPVTEVDPTERERMIALGLYVDSGSRLPDGRVVYTATKAGRVFLRLPPDEQAEYLRNDPSNKRETLQ